MGGTVWPQPKCLVLRPRPVQGVTALGAHADIDGGHRKSCNETPRKQSWVGESGRGRQLQPGTGRRKLSPSSAPGVKALLLGAGM